jgi:hypothetical protein
MFALWVPFLALNQDHERVARIAAPLPCHENRSGALATSLHVRRVIGSLILAPGSMTAPVASSSFTRPVTD